MVRQVILKNNRRAAGLLLTLASLPIGLGMAGLVWAWWNSSWPWAAGAGGVTTLGLILAASAWRWWITPRLSICAGQLEVHLRKGAPHRIPLEFVEVIFLGQAPSTLRDAKGQEMETRNVVIRLAERASEWHQQDAERALGRWCDGYITVYGTWCEPLTKGLVENMNHQLVQAKRVERQRSKGQDA